MGCFFTQQPSCSARRSSGVINSGLLNDRYR
jgi:hypothetical protein